MKERLSRYLRESEKKTKAEALLWLLLHVQNQPLLILDEALAQEWGWTAEAVISFLEELHPDFEVDTTRKGWLVIQQFVEQNQFVFQTTQAKLTRGKFGDTCKI